MNNSLEYKVPTDAVPEYVKKMLTAVPEGIFLPVSIIGERKEEKSLTVVSDATGFIPLKDAGNMLTAERVYIYLEKILRAFTKMSEYMINPADLVLTKESIFVNAENDVRMLFLPRSAGEFSKTVNAIIKQILIEIGGENISRDLRSYMNATMDLLEKNCSASDLFAHIIKLRREAKLCGIQ